MRRARQKDWLSALLGAAQIAQSHSLVNVSNIRLGVGDAAQAIAIALEALPSDMEKQDRPYVPEAELALRTAYRYAQSNQFRTAWSGEADQPISTSSLNPDGRIVATAYGGTVRIIDRSLNSVVGSFDAGSAIWALHFLPNGQLVIATSTELRVYDIANKSDVSEPQNGKQSIDLRIGITTRQKLRKFGHISLVRQPISTIWSF